MSTPREEQTLTGRAVKETSRVLSGVVSQRSRVHWTEFLLIILLGDHLGLYEVAAVLQGGSMSIADFAILAGVIGRIVSQFGGNGGARRTSDR